MIVLGLDVSTSITGYCLLEKNKDTLSLLEAGSFSLSKIKNHFQKAELVKNELLKIRKNFLVEKISIESSLQSFRPGMSSAKTLYSLAKFNGVVSYICYEVFCQEPEFVNASSARSKLGLKIRRGEKNTKEQVLEWVETNPIFSDYEWPEKTLKNGPRRGKTIRDPCCYDIADASVVALYTSGF